VNLANLRAVPIFGRPIAAETWAAAWLQTSAELVIGVGSATLRSDAATLIAMLACCLAGTAVLGPGSVLERNLLRRSVLTVLLAAIALAVFANVIAPPVAEPAFLTTMVAAGGVGMLAVVIRGHLASLLLAVALIAQFALACWMIAVLAEPPIDVHTFQQEGAAALLAGENPYSLRFLISPGGVYADELQVGDRLAFGFPYPPLSLLMAVPG
jgi:hypothetical protein